jgi:arylsulfatase A
VRFLLSLLLLPALATSLPAVERKPNLVILLADDLGWGDVGINGRTDWKTPNIDRLASQGTAFKRWYTAGVVCAPSRAALMTGKYGIHNGVSGNNDDLPRNQTTLPEALRKQGYHTAIFGKWHHGKPRPGEKSYRHPFDLGFDEFMGFTDAVDAWQHFPKELWFGREKKPVHGHADTMFADQAVEFIKRNRENPFFLYVPFITPHLIIQAPEEEVAEFRGKFPEKDPKNPIRATYAAMITRLDKNIGRVLAAIDEAKLGDDTLIVFSSDHGATFETDNRGASAFHDSNRPFRGQKRTLWEGGMRVPAVVRWNGHVPAGKVSDEVIHMTDVFPSFLAAAGMTPDSAWKVDGANVLPVWQGKVKVPERTLFWEWRVEGYHQIAAMRGNRKLVITANEPAELFDVVNDPAERRSLAKEYPEETAKLRKELTEWLSTETEESKWGKTPAKKP